MTHELLLDECARVVRLLDGAGIFCVVIGGLAMHKLGFPRAPKDIDLAIDTNWPLASKLLQDDGYQPVGGELNLGKGELLVDLIFQGMGLPCQPRLLHEGETLPSVGHPSAFGERNGFATPKGIILSKLSLLEEKHKKDISEVKARYNLP